MPENCIDRIPVSVKLSVDDKALLIALSIFLTKRGEKLVSQSETLRKALLCLAEQEKGNGFTQ